jgi:hypothetical protein
VFHPEGELSFVCGLFVLLLLLFSFLHGFECGGDVMQVDDSLTDNKGTRKKQSGKSSEREREREATLPKDKSKANAGWVTSLFLLE